MIDYHITYTHSVRSLLPVDHWLNSVTVWHPPVTKVNVYYSVDILSDLPVTPLAKVGNTLGPYYYPPTTPILLVVDSLAYLSHRLLIGY